MNKINPDKKYEIVAKYIKDISFEIPSQIALQVQQKIWGLIQQIRPLANHLKIIWKLNCKFLLKL